MNNWNKKIGNRGEKLAKMFLVKQGYNILEENFARKYAEIDIIAEKNDFLGFFEVKTSYIKTPNVSYETSYRPEIRVNRAKLNKIHKLSEALIRERFTHSEFRVGIIAIYLYEKKDPNIELIWE